MKSSVIRLRLSLQSLESQLRYKLNAPELVLNDATVDLLISQHNLTIEFIKTIDLMGRTDVVKKIDEGIVFVPSDSPHGSDNMRLHNVASVVLRRLKKAELQRATG